MQRALFASGLQQVAGGIRAVDVEPAVAALGGIQRVEPALQRGQLRQRTRARGMDAFDGLAEDTRSLVVVAAPDHFQQRAPAGGTLHQQRLVVVGQHPGRALAVPPVEQYVAETLFFGTGYLQHRRCAAMAHRQQAAAVGGEGLAVGLQRPALEVGREIEGFVHGRSQAPRRCWMKSRKHWMRSASCELR